MEEPADAVLHGHDPVNWDMGKAEMRIDKWFEPMWGAAGSVLRPVCE